MNRGMMWGLVIAAFILGGIIGFAFERGRATVKMETYKMQAQKQLDEVKMAASPKNEVTEKSPVTMLQDAKLGLIAQGENGMTLYTYDKDTLNKSNCLGACATKWPPYTVTGAVPANLPAHMSSLTRDDGTVQYAWDGKPLYFYQNDKAKGEVTGDGVGGVWHVVK
jgi:predicted lipoprotein with Yx(FWY)xxD motif